MLHRTIKRFTFIFFAFLISTSPKALDKESIFNLHQDGHTYTVINAYSCVESQVDKLLEQNIDPEKIFILTDWDDVIISPGTWLQKSYKGEYFFPETKRMLLEHEVDGNLRDSNTLKIQKNIQEKGIRIVIFTARSAVMDERLPTLVNNDNILDTRHSEQPDKIDYDYIINATKNALNDLSDEKILEEARIKVEKMTNQSGCDLRNQSSLPRNFVEPVKNQGRKMVYYDGYTFTGHDKGPFAVSFLKKFDQTPSQVIIVDDSPRAMKSYYGTLNEFKEIGVTVHLLHYPTL